MSKMKARAENYKPNDEYYTPEWIFQQLGIEFDLDVASPINGVPWIPTKSIYTIQDNGLEKPWNGRVWMNPPFSKQKPWILKFMEHKNGIALLPWAKSLSLNAIWNSAEAITVLPSNLQFQHLTDGTKGMFITCGLFAYGEENVEALKRLEHRVR